jgi:DHA1 family multidrug resistance protein-like MFS transporter
MALFNRSVISVYIAYSLQAAAQAISLQFVTYFIKHELYTSSFLEESVALALPAIVVMVATNAWGSLSDQSLKRKPFMIIGFLGYATTFLFYAFARDIIQFLAVAVIGACFSSAALPMGQALLTTNAPNKGERLGYFVAAQSAGWFIGALFSGAFYDIIGMRLLFIIAAALSLGATASSALLVYDMPFSRTDSHTRQGFRDLLQKPRMSWLTLSVALSQIGLNAISAFLAILIVDELGAGETSLIVYVGLANSGATFIAILITGRVGKLIDKRGPIKVLIFAYASYSVFAFLFGVVTDPVVAAILWALPIYPLSSTATSTLAAQISGEDERGRAMSLIYGAQNAGGWIGPLVGGFFAEYVFFAVQPISFLNMAFNIAALFLAISILRRTRSIEQSNTLNSNIL